jgi:putative DNA primase/helicase
VIGTRKPQKALNTALGLARLGWHVFPVKTDGTKAPPSGFLWTELSTTDPETIVEWWDGDFAGFEIGIHLGRSGLVVVDVDRHEGKPDGAETLRAHHETHPLPETFTYATLSGGEHHYYLEHEGGPYTQRVGVLSSVDIKAGDGYVVYWKKAAPAEAPVLARAPEWALIPLVTRNTEDAFSGSITAWLDLIPEGKATKAAKAACKRAQSDGVGHADMLDIVAGIVREATVTPDGMRPLIEAARDRYLAHPQARAKSWDEAFEGSIKAQGAPASRRPPRALSKDLVRQARVVFETPKGMTGPADRPESFPVDPIDYFDGAQIRAGLLADSVSHGIAVGYDGMPWVFDGGVYRPRKGVFTTRLKRRLGDRYRTAYESMVQQMVMNDDEVTPRLTGEPHEDFINLKRGMYHWKTDTWHAHDPAYLSTVQLPFEYDEHATCPAFDAWLDQVVRPADLRTVWEVIGYALMNGNPLQKAVLLIGAGGNGKSTFLDVLKSMFAEENISATTLGAIASHRFAMAGIFGKALIAAGDIEHGYLKETARVKQLIGQDSVMAERKGKDEFTFTPWATAIFSSNSMIRTSDSSPGFVRRWLPIEFPNSFQPGTLDREALFAEAPGIFNKAMPYLRELMERKAFTMSFEALELLELLRAGSNPLLQWLTDPDTNVESEAGSERLSIATSEAWEKYRVWMKSSNMEQYIMMKTRFLPALEALGYTRYKSGTWRIRGIEAKAAVGYVPATINHPDA